jgi:hypothetical protein
MSRTITVGRSGVIVVAALALLLASVAGASTQRTAATPWTLAMVNDETIPGSGPQVGEIRTGA